MQRILTLDEIKGSLRHLRDAFKQIREIKKRDEIANLIKYPQIPSVITESLAIYLIKDNITELKDHELILGGSVADIIAKKYGTMEKIEVKATGKSAFQYFSHKDIKANYLIWIHFDKFFDEESNIPIEVFVLKNPSAIFKFPTKIVLEDFKIKAGNGLVNFTYNIP